MFDLYCLELKAAFSVVCYFMVVSVRFLQKFLAVEALFKTKPCLCDEEEVLGVEQIC